MTYHAIIEMPVNATVTDSVLVHEARVIGNMKYLKKKSLFNTLDWPPSSFFLVNTNSLFSGM